MRLRNTLLLLLCSGGLNAANHYVLDGGSGDGTSWSSAWDVLPTTLVRGDAYYIGDGVYAGYDFDTAASGTTLITIKKATAADHGTETGWSSTHGDGVAAFGSSAITTDYWVIDGATRTGRRTGHGISFSAPSTASKAVNMRYATTDLTFRYVRFIGNGPDGEGVGGANDLLYTPDGINNLTLQFCSFYNSGRVHILSAGTTTTSGWLVEDCDFHVCETDALEHSESWSVHSINNVIVRRCWFEDIEGTAIIAVLDSATGCNGWQVYNNVFLNCIQISGGVLGTDAESAWENVLFYGNTMVNVGPSGGIHVDNGSTTGWRIYNNLWYDCDGVLLASDASTFDHDYNWYYPGVGTGGDLGESNGQVGTGDPFVSVATGDLHLSAETATGSTLGNPYNVDYDGVTRGSDGTWDRGAFEYGGSLVFGGTAVYVASTGSDTNVGTISHPVLTYTNAVVIAAAESVTNIIFRNGSYPSMLVQRSNIRLAAENSRQAIVTNSTGFGIQTWACTNVIIDGLTVQDSANSGIKFSTTGNTARNCWLLRNGNSIDTSGLECNAAASTNTLVENCLIELNGDFTPIASPQGHGIYASGTGQVIRNNIIRSNAGFGIQFYSGGSVIQHGAMIYNNLTYGHTNAYGMTVYGATEADTGAGTNYVLNNTIFDGLDLEHGWARVTNNIIWPSALAPTEPINSFRSGSVPVIWTDYNVMSHAFTNGTSNITTNDAHLASDYKLTADSPAVNAGTDLSAYFSTDLAGVTRSGTWEIGAYEYAETQQGGTGTRLNTGTARVGTIRRP